MFVGYRVGAACSAYPTVVMEAPVFLSVRVLGSMCTHDLLLRRRLMASRVS